RWGAQQGGAAGADDQPDLAAGAGGGVHPEVYASPLAETPYDLRHAAVSTWLNAGISPTQVAEWAGQSPEVLWRNYAKCLAGGEAELQRRMEAGYGGRRDAPNFGTYSAQIVVEGR
ncbi:MAG TPA: hypothetical protein VGQ92_06835, partial [Actinoplanes sp.]|nr:hypothetical protein [Actinoplanes sp.]